MKTLSRWMLIGVLVANALIAMFLIGGATASPIQAQTAPDNSETDPSADAPSREALLLLGRELAERAEQLALREADLDELRRGEEVRLRAGLTPASGDLAEPDTAVAAGAAPATESATADKVETAADQAFGRLSKAYENMEPDSAALALAELASIDTEAVVQLLVGWPPRTSGAILDSLTQIKPELAARLSYKIWKRSGNSVPQAADSDR